MSEGKIYLVLGRLTWAQMDRNRFEWIPPIHSTFDEACRAAEKYREDNFYIPVDEGAWIGDSDDPDLFELWDEELRGQFVVKGVLVTTNTEY